MKKLLTMAAALTMLIVPATVKAETLETGAAAPDFTATTITGETFTLSDHKGEVVVLEWSNHQCPFVRKHYESNNMQQTQKTATADGVTWVTIVSSADGKQGNVTPEEAAQIITDTGAAPTAKILDPSADIANLYHAKTTPHMYIIDTEGTLVYQGAIDDNSSPNPATIEGATNYVLAALADIKAGTPVQTAQTQPYGCGIKF